MPSKAKHAAAALPLALGAAMMLANGPAPSGDTGSAATNAAVVTHAAALWSGPSLNASRLGTVTAGTVVHVLNNGHKSGYLRVQTDEEETGWVYDRSVRAIS